MTVVVFTGPTLPPDDARNELQAVFLPPVSMGDVYRTAESHPTAIGIIDGYFERVPSVWHKEILFAIRQGVAVFGAASMGALRAAELAPFGMVGVGAIFAAFRDGTLEDDDEVAVIHGPAAFGYPNLSDAMVNIRRTLSDAVGVGVISHTNRAKLEAIAKSLAYPDRTYVAIIDRARNIDIDQGELVALLAWLPAGRVDQKREDAIALLREIRTFADNGIVPTAPSFHFEHTTLWERATRLAAAANG